MPNYDFLNKREHLTTNDIHDCEQLSFKEENILNRICQRLIVEVRSLQHELADPNYQYVGRIHRNAILTRDAEIDRLRTKIKELEAKCLPQQEPTPKVC